MAAAESVVLDHARYVLIDRFSQMTGYTRKAVEGKIRTGVWLEGMEYIRSPDGHLQIDMQGYYRWVESARG